MTAHIDPNSAHPTDRIYPFISGIPPFAFLPDDELEKIAKELMLVTHPKGTLLFIQGSAMVKHLYIIRNGAVERYYEEGGKKTLRGMLGEGDTYGGISMLVNDGLSVRTVLVCEDTDFYILEEARFLELCKTYDSFSEYFTDTFGKRMINHSYAAILKNNTNLGDESSQLFNMPIRTICRLNRHRFTRYFPGTPPGQWPTINAVPYSSKHTRGIMPVSLPITIFATRWSHRGMIFIAL